MLFDGGLKVEVLTDMEFLHKAGFYPARLRLWYVRLCREGLGG